MENTAGNRKLVVLGIGKTEYLVQGEGSESDIRNVIQKMVPKSDFSLHRLAEAEMSALRNRLKPAQVELLDKFHAQRPAPATNNYRIEFKTAPSVRAHEEKKLSDQELEAIAGGLSAFDPQLSQVNRPLVGGLGPVGITVGVGIAGKF
jgi:hypothetical protein